MRGIVGENLTPSIAAEYGCAFGKFLKNRHTDKKGKLSVCIGRDSRSSGQMLKSAVATGLCTVGIDVVDLGLVTTPGVGIMVRELQCNGGVIITASHNPIQYNGIKLLLGNGIAPPAEEAERIRQYFFDKHFALVDSLSHGKITSNEQTDAAHITRVLAIVNKEAIAAKKFKAVLDSVNGAGGRVTKKMLAELGCEVIAINDEPSGIFAHRPEPTARNLTGLCRIVKEKEADIGFAQDPESGANHNRTFDPFFARLPHHSANNLSRNNNDRKVHFIRDIHQRRICLYALDGFRLEIDRIKDPFEPRIENIAKHRKTYAARPVRRTNHGN